ncbi:membrane-associated zinc metalloprotease [Vibrio ishigakensis]|uniref:Membrane-associated zinc metalloprotease n=1 Tax=Vibrio ishigakensis TaxID=1481914 RepID=A0A0B8PGT5_9VIBR|nr:membrane-associated zinc metalloprotease [Vibrio ishigakensis]
MIGIPAVKPVIGDVTPNSIVAEAGILPGMELTSVNGVKTADWESVNMGLVAKIGDDSMTMTLTSPDELGLEKQYTLDLREWSFDPETESAMSTLGFRPYSPEIYLTLATVQEGGAAEQAGLEVGDTILSVNGESVTQWQEFATIIRDNPGRSLELAVDRNGSVERLT